MEACVRSTVFVLYYQHRWEDEPELVCACDSKEAVEAKIHKLTYMFPALYDDNTRFRVTPIEFEKFEGVVTN